MRKRLFLIGIGLLVLFALLSKFEDRQILRSLDFAATVKLQGWIDDSSHLRLAAVIANIMEGATAFASPSFTVIVTLIVSGMSVYDAKGKRFRYAALIIPVMLVALVAAEVVGKSLVHHPSPPFTMIKNPTSMFPSDYVNEQYSYPSGHSARAVFMGITGYVLLMASGLLRHNAARAAAILGIAAYIVTVSVSRIYLGHHWLSDVLGGLVLGGGMGMMASLWYTKHA